MGHDESYIRRCIQLATNALGNTYPNPLVGSVIVHDGRIIGEGFHQQAGKPHAEPEAIARVEDTSLLPSATIYVNLEPCAHHGRTGPCAHLIAGLRVKRVVVGTRDPFEHVNGKGIAYLRAHGAEVVEGILEPECRFLNRRFFTFHEKQRPYIILKWAETADGFMDADRAAGERGSYRISSPASDRLVHLWRTQEQAILVGGRTAITDDPQLTARHVAGNQPVRIVRDSRGGLPSSLRVLSDGGPTIVLNGKNLEEDLATLCHEGIQSVLVEGGARTLRSFLESGHWDEARVIRSSALLGSGLPAPVLSLPARSTETVGDDLISYYYRV